MPIYAYRCASCGHAQDTLQKMSDPVLTVCPACGAAAYAKQLTAAGFQLKGSGWYVTDFRGGNTKKPATEGEGEVVKPDDKPDDKTADKTADKAAADKPATDKAAAPAAPGADSKTVASPAPAPAAPAPTPSSSG